MGGVITNISKKSRHYYICFFIFFLISAFAPLYVQNSAGTVPPAGGEQTADGEALSSNSEKNLPINSAEFSFPAVPDTVKEGGANTLWLFIRMVLVLALVIVCIYVLVFFLKKGLYPKTPDNPFLKKALSLTLAPGKSIYAVTLPGAAWLVGASEAGVQLIAEIKDKELIDLLILEAEKTPAEKPRDFAGIFAAFTDTAKQTEALLKKQRGRFGEGGNE